MRFTAEAGGTNLHYEISFGSKIPGLDLLVAQGLKKNVAKGLGERPGRLRLADSPSASCRARSREAARCSEARRFSRG